jgi:hypothetical protein
MLELSRPPGAMRPHTIAGPPKVLPIEIDNALQRRFGRPERPRNYPIFAEGVAHAFGQAALTYRLPSDLDAPRGVREKLELAGTWFLETAALTGPSNNLPLPGLDSETYKQSSRRFLDADQLLKQRIADLRPSPPTRAQWLAGLSIIDVLDEINIGLGHANVDANELATSATEMTSFLRDLPSRWVDYELQRLRHDDRTIKRDRGDLNDLSALSIAIPYCDIVVTERLWVDLLKRARLDRKYDTAVLDKITKLPDLLR